MTVACPHCKRTIKVTGELAGKRVTCSACHGSMRLPGKQPAAEPAGAMAPSGMTDQPLPAPDAGTSTSTDDDMESTSLPRPSRQSYGTGRSVDPGRSRTYRNKLRQNSCYPALRGFITISSGLDILVGLGLCVVAVAGYSTMDLSTVLIMIGVGVGFVGLGIVTKEASSVVIDIADTLLDVNSTAR